jgi:hypothetical protein
MPAASLPLKAGASLQLGMVLQADDGTPIDVSAATISCGFRDGVGNTFPNGTITLASGTGAFLMSVPPSGTAEFTPGEIFSDVLILLPSGTFFSDTFMLAVSPPITEPS